MQAGSQPLESLVNQKPVKDSEQLLLSEITKQLLANNFQQTLSADIVHNAHRKINLLKSVQDKNSSA